MSSFRTSCATSSPCARISASGRWTPSTTWSHPDAAERGGASPIIAELPDGYDTTLGRRWARGLEFSGGQWQKIALARAFMRKAEVLVLDEPTSALDAEAEYEVFRRFGELMEGRIAVLISHRFSTVRMADRIAVLSAGKIIELGSHAELMDLTAPTLACSTCRRRDIAKSGLKMQGAVLFFLDSPDIIVLREKTGAYRINYGSKRRR